MKSRIDFTVGQDKFYVMKPTQEQVAQAEFVYKTKYSEALRYGALTHHEAERIIEERNLFTEDDAKSAGKLLFEITELSHKLSKEDKLSKGLDILIKIDGKRREVLTINRRRNAILDNTAEAYADEQRLHYYIIACTYQGNGEKVFANTEELIARSNDDVAVKATKYTIYIVANEGEDFRSEWPDYQWRVKHNLVDSDMNPVDEIPEDFKKKLQEEVGVKEEVTPA